MKKITCLIVSFVVSFSIKSIADDLYKDYHIISQNENNLVIEFATEQFRFDTVVVNHKKYINIRFPLASLFGDAGDPMLPVRNFIVGVPPSGRVNLTVLSVDYKQVEGITLLPVPDFENEDEFTREVYEEGSVFSTSENIPGKVAELINPGYIRDQKVITLRLSPVQYNPGSGIVFLYNKIRIQLSFDSEKSSVTAVKRKPKGTTIIDKGVINPEQAEKWRTSEPLKTSKIQRSGFSGISYKIPVYEPGIYKLTGNFLRDNGVDISSIEPETIKIYNNGGKALPRDITAERPDGIVENPILVYGTEDGSFDESDYVVFYGKGTSGWEFNTSRREYEHYINIYDNRNIYFLVYNDGTEGKRIKTIDNTSIAETKSVTTARQKIFLENDEHNLISGGIQWYGNEFSNTRQQKSYQLLLEHPVLNSTINFKFRFKGGTSHTHQFRLSLNQNQFKTFNFYGSGEQTVYASYSGFYESGAQELIIQYLTSGVGAKAYLDWYESEYPCELKAVKGKLSFFSPRESGIYTYQLSDLDESPLALDITNPTDVRKMKIESIEHGWTFTDSVDLNRIPRYYIVDKSGYKTPSELLEDEISDLRNSANQADLLLITHKDFFDQALQFKSHKEVYDSISVFVCDIQNVYDEFSSGVMDAVAIRDFVKYSYDNWTKKPSMLLLFGDGDFDYRNILSDNDKNWIPPFEYDGDSHNAARATDDWYTYVSGNDTYMDLSVGRFPVQTTQEAQAVIDKIIQYESNPVFGWWKNLFTLVGDDEKGGPGSVNEDTHINATEKIAEKIIPDKYELKKIYLTEYPEILSRKPDVTADLIEQVNMGTVWVNYIGHGNRKVLAHERIFERDRDINKLVNKEKHSFFYAATCHFGRYDKPDEQSGAELLFTSTEGIGAIGVIAASRDCASTPNEALNELVLQELIGTGNSIRIGEALAIAKNKNSYINNDEKYILFADPSLRLAVPTYNSVITDIQPDTLKALGKFTVRGRIEKNGTPWTGFNGSVFLKCFDSKKNIVYTNEDVTLDYALSGNSIFRGQKENDGSSFEFSFIIPKDISYGGTTARISTYFYNKTGDGNGSRESLPVGGSCDLEDVQGPEITIYFAGYENFITGDMIEENPEMIVSLVDDKSGINITEEIGHKIMLYIDDQDPVNLTQYFQYEKDSYLAGNIHYTLNGLSAGRHTILLKAWDNANNSSQKSVSFEIVPKDELRIKEVLNYPNPMQKSTHFTFKLNKDADIDIKIYTASGNLICTLSSVSGFAGFNMIPWNGRDEMGDPVANGVYLYKLIARSYESGSAFKKEKIGKLIIMR